MVYTLDFSDSNNPFSIASTAKDKPPTSVKLLCSTLPRPKHFAHQALGHEGFQAEALFLHLVVDLVDE